MLPLWQIIYKCLTTPVGVVPAKFQTGFTWSPDQCCQNSTWTLAPILTNPQCRDTFTSGDGSTKYEPGLIVLREAMS